MQAAQANHTAELEVVREETLATGQRQTAGTAQLAVEEASEARAATAARAVAAARQVALPLDPTCLGLQEGLAGVMGTRSSGTKRVLQRTIK